MKPAALLLSLALPSALHAQGTRHAFVPAGPPAEAPLRSVVDPLPARSDLTLAFGGVMSGIGGLLAGGFIGARLEMAGGCSGDWCGLGGALLGAAVGSTIMIPAGVHLANDQRGSFATGLGASAVALGAGTILSLMTQDGRPMLLVPVAQIIGAVAAERRSSRAGPEEDPVIGAEFP